MPRKPKRLCTKAGCPGLYDPATETCSRCGKRERTGWDRNKRRGTRQERGYDEPYLKLRRQKKTANPLCEECERNGYTTLMKEVHHIVSFDGLNDPLRLDWDNLESLCKTCHLRKSRVEARKHRRVVVSGPWAGKTTYVERHSKPGAVCWDYDKVLATMTGLEKADRPVDVIPMMGSMLQAMIESLRRTPVDREVWVIITNDDKATAAASRLRAELVRCVRPGEVVCG